MLPRLACAVAGFVIFAYAIGAEPRADSVALRVEGLNYETALSAISSGHFDEAGIRADGDTINIIVFAYRDVFSEKCSSSLPTNRVEILEDRCGREQWLTDGRGEVPGSRHCTNMVKIGTGRYADPEVNRVANLLAANQSRNGALAASLRDPLGYAAGQVQKQKNAYDDMNRLIALNGCSSSAIKWFQANLLRFGSGHQGIIPPEWKRPEGPDNLYRGRIERFIVASWISDRRLVKNLERIDFDERQSTLSCVYLEDKGYIEIRFLYKYITPELISYVSENFWQGPRTPLSECPKKSTQARAVK